MMPFQKATRLDQAGRERDTLEQARDTTEQNETHSNSTLELWYYTNIY